MAGEQEISRGFFSSRENTILDFFLIWIHTKSIPPPPAPNTHRFEQAVKFVLGQPVNR